MSNLSAALQPSPIARLPAHDYGAETHRNYRYQSAFAIVLLVAAAAKKVDYKAVWCEQEDDILAQVDDNFFDPCQIKTKKPELGPWAITDDAFAHSVGAFIELNRKYPDRFRRFHFVSNTECLESESKDKKHLCPKRLAGAATAHIGWTDLSGVEAKGFKMLLNKIKATEEELFGVLKRLLFAKGPSRDSFIAELAQNHLRQLDWCQLPQTRLEFLVRTLLEIVDSASSLSAQDPARHYACLNCDADTDPQLRAKRITVEDFTLRTRELAAPKFRYLPSLTTSPLAQTSKDLKRFKQKLSRGDLDDYADSLRNQMISAEAEFYDLVTRGPDEEALVVQIENVVKTECDEAHLRASQGKKPFGQRMLIDVQDRLHRIAEEEPQKVGDQPYEALMGMVGLLTDKCPVWWSQRFSLENQP